MKNSLYNKRHLKEYLTFGLFAATGFIIPEWIFFFLKDYNQMAMVFLGSALFMFVIMVYVLKLSNRRPEYKSSWMMAIAAHMAVLTGIVISVLFTVVLCFIYIPGFFSGQSPEVLKDAPSSLNEHNWGLITVLFTCATVENFGAGGFMAILGPYVFKKNQKKDKTAILESDINPKNA